jgi:hypothetical protein
MSAVPPHIIEPIWEEFAALLPERNIDHPLGCHRSRVPDRVVFEKLVQVLVFGRAYWRISDRSVRQIHYAADATSRWRPVRWMRWRRSPGRPTTESSALSWTT